jgi:hypothetical protein
MVTRVARGFLARLYVRAVRRLLQEYINDLCDRHSDSPTKPARSLVFTHLDHFSQISEVVAKRVADAPTKLKSTISNGNESGNESDAALTIQRNVRMYQAKSKTATLREEHERRWEEKRRAALEEECRSE